MVIFSIMGGYPEAGIVFAMADPIQNLTIFKLSYRILYGYKPPTIFLPVIE